MYTWEQAVERCKEISQRHGRGHTIVEDTKYKDQPDRYVVAPTSHKNAPWMRERAHVHGKTLELTRLDEDPV